VFGPFGRPAHVTSSPAPAVGAAHQMLPIGKMLPIRQMLLIGKMLPIRQMLLILPVAAVGAVPHDILCDQFVQKLQDESAFTNEEKVQMMQSIAEEFSVPFNSNTLEVKTCWWREQISQVTFSN
jgi:hypothetical protein